MLEEFYRMEMGNKLLISVITGIVRKERGQT